MGDELTTLKDKDYKYLSEKTEGYSNADLFLIVQDALMEPVRMALKATHFKKVK